MPKTLWVVSMEWWIFHQMIKWNLTYIFSSKVLYITLFSNGEEGMGRESARARASVWTWRHEEALVHLATPRVSRAGDLWFRLAFLSVPSELLFLKFPNKRDFSNTEILVFSQKYTWLYDSCKVMVSKGHRVSKLKQCFPEKMKRWTFP